MLKAVINGIQGLSGFLRIRTTESAPQVLKPYSTPDVDAQPDLLRARTQLLQLFRSLEELADVANVRTRAKLDLPDAVSTSGLGLDLTETAATLASSEEINASLTSFSPFGPDWTDGSSALLTIGGEYNGAQGTGQLDFEVRRAGVHGSDRLRIRVYDPQGSNMGNIQIPRNDPLDQQYDIGNGLYLQLGSGSLVNRDLASIQVYDAVPSVVDTNLPLGGVRNQNPNLQFGMPAIANGSFSLNGESISVSTTDTINDVINRINGSTAGVTATFNSLTESIDFLQNMTGSAPTIDLQNDTSNFLQATKLDSINTIPGIDPDDVKSLEDVGAFSSVQSGNIVINGQQIAIDASTDSLTSVLDRINTSGAGVTASFDETTQKVTIEALDSESRLDISSNGTNFFSAIRVPEGQVDAEALSNGISRRRSYAIADALENSFGELSYLFQDASFANLGSNISALRAPLEGALRTMLGDGDTLARLGLGYDSGADARRRGDYAETDRRILTTNLQLRGDRVLDVLRGKGSEEGLVERLLVGTTQALRSVNSLLGRSGTFIDTLA